MIGRLTGKVLAHEEDGAIVVDVAGVGYEVTVPLGTVGRASTDDTGRTTLYVHTHAREDQLVLFGFATIGDRVAFRTLIGVSSVGPKTAIAVLGALPAPDLARAISAKDVSKLTSVPGIGKKTAERLLLELRDKIALAGVVPPTDGAPTAGRAPQAAPALSTAELTISALTRMGYKQTEAERAVNALGDKADKAPLTEVVREALALLAK
ncbi:Holliday junction branch migration protein RuvA [Pendulispora rubella]|uniref:Holliday junction branch migration complex subunit RuvA n=1 Tax=Pendulispora rubella TaxID=2741070 RepID=A0ABZ2L7K0_9BACT